MRYPEGFIHLIILSLSILNHWIRRLTSSWNISTTCLNAFDSTSVISQVNQNRDIRVDTLFQKVFKKALEVSAETNGAYDVTCAPLINLWGFGFSRKDSVTPAHIDSVRQFIGFQKVRLEGDRIVKDDPRLMMNFSSLADGTACDMIAQMLEKKGVRNYLVEFGGEMRVKAWIPRAWIALRDHEATDDAAAWIKNSSRSLASRNR